MLTKISHSKYIRPFPMLLAVLLAFSFFSLMYVFFSSYHLSQIGVMVNYESAKDDFLVVEADQTDSGTNAAFYLKIHAGDRITAIDGEAISTFIRSRDYYIVNQDETTKEVGDTFPIAFYHWPLPESQKMLLLSVKATSLTLQKSSDLQSNKVDLSDFAPNNTDNLLLIVELIIGLIFWLTSAILYVFKPDKIITLCFICFFDPAAIYLLGSVKAQVDKDIFLLILIVTSSCIASLAFIYFSLLFPYGNLPSKKVNLAILLLSFLVITVNLIHLYLCITGVSNIALQKEVRLWRLRSISISVVLGVVIMIVHYVRSTGLEKAKLKLVFTSFLFATIVPLSVFILYTLFGLFYDFSINYFAFLCVPCVLFPLGSLYAILKHNLFYSEFIIRRALHYLTLTGLMWAIYLTCSFGLSLILKSVFGIGDDLVGIAAFFVVAIGISKLKAIAQTFIDSIFYRNELNLTTLLKNWTDRLASCSDSFTALISALTRDLTLDFHYQDIAMIMVLVNNEFPTTNDNFYRSELLSKGNHLQSQEGSEVSPSQSYQILIASYRQGEPSKGLKKDIMNNPTLQRLINVKELNGLNINLTTREAQNLPAALLTDKDMVEEPFELEHFNTSAYQYFIPFSQQCCVVGGLLFGSKLLNRVPVPEERDVLVSITRQTAMAINAAIKLQLEYALRQRVRLYVVKNDNLRDEEQANLARDIHDTLGSDASQILSKLGTWLVAQENSANQNQSNTQDLIKQAHEIAKALKGHISAMLRQTRSIPMTFGLITVLKEFMVSKQELDTMFNFRFFPELTSFQKNMLGQRFTIAQLGHIYRIVQEAVTNAIKHSGGNLIIVRLAWSQVESLDELVVTIQDNGKGFDSTMEDDELLRWGHYGLVSMRDRVGFVGGELHCENYYSDGNVAGALIRATFPIPVLDPPTITDSTTTNKVDQIDEEIEIENLIIQNIQ